MIEPTETESLETLDAFADTMLRIADEASTPEGAEIVKSAPHNTPCLLYTSPDLVPYNMATMPRPPKKYVIKIDPSSEKLTVTELEQAPRTATENKAPTVEFDRINWLHTFDASLQFSQAYVSPNWYQGGKSNLNMIANLVYNIKLNQKFHPDVMFETNVAYKLGVNNAPDDTVHNYNISEDLFQINMRFGIKAMRHWYYSVNTQFKTQLLNRCV